MPRNNLPTMGRAVHYVSERAPYVESTAIVIDEADTFMGVLDGTPDELTNGYDTRMHCSLRVDGLVNDYRRYNVPYGRALPTDPLEKAPGTWHWWDECDGINNHIV